MSMSQGTATKVAEDLLAARSQEKDLLDRIDGWMRKDPERIITRDSSDPEIRYLKKLSQAPWASLVIETVAQALSLEGLYAADRQPEDLRAMWGPWDRNRMGARQGPLYRAAGAYGYAFVVALPKWDGTLNRIPKAVLTPVSPRQMTAEYADVVDDEFPMYAIRVIPQGNGKKHIRLIDESHVHYLGQEDDTSRIEWIESRKHGLGYTPVIRYANQMDLEGRAPGEIEPLIPLLSRINKTDYDRMLVQHYNSWKIRTATGIDKPAEGEEDKTKMKLRQDDILVGGEDAQFGTLDETAMDPFVKAHDSDVEALAATSQTPATAFGKLVNVSAEGLQEARASLRAKLRDRKVVHGSSNVQTLRVSSDIEGRKEDAENFTVKAKWGDEDVTYLSSAVDALGKAATMLGVPPALLWDRIPNIDGTTADSWRKFAKENPSADQRQADAMAAALGPNL